MYNIENDILKIEIDEKGAELKRVFHLQHQMDYLWSGDPAYWGKTSPVLFPIVGTLKENTYYYEGHAYTLPRHGFARDKRFAVSKQTQDTITFLLESSEDTLKVYPFPFQFFIRYALQGDTLAVTYQVKNTGEDALFFSVGGHPAFKLPLAEGSAYTDYRLVFEKKETTERWPISKDGLIETGSIPLLNGTSELPLSKELFSKDAIVFKTLESETVRLVSDKTAHGLHFSFSGFPYLGLWAAPGADFLCIEPWCGIADSVDSDQELTGKEGIVSLPPDDSFDVTWRVQFF